VIGLSEVEEAVRDQAAGQSIRGIAATLGAYVAVTGSYTREGGRLVFRGEGLAVETGERVFSVESGGPESEVESILRDFQSRTAGLAVLGRSGFVDLTKVVHPPTYEAAVEYLQGVRVRRAGDYDAALPHYREAHALDTAFLLPVVSQVWALNERSALGGPDLWAEIDSLFSFLSARSGRLNPGDAADIGSLGARVKGDLEAVLRAARISEEAAGRKNDHGIPVAALAFGRPQEALNWLDDFDPFTLQSTWYAWEASALANHWLGRHAEALAEAREGRSHFPQNFLLLRREIQSLIALGRIEEIAPLLDELEDLDPDSHASPGLVYYRVAGDLFQFGHREGAEQLAERALEWYRLRDPHRFRLEIAQASLLAGRPDDALSALGPLIDENPDSLSIRGVRGIAYALVGKGDSASAEAEWFGRMDTPYLFGEDVYWQAAILAHLGVREEAVRLLRRAHEQGRSWSTPSERLGDIISDPNFMRLWEYEPFEQLIAPKG